MPIESTVGVQVMARIDRAGWESLGASVQGRPVAVAGFGPETSRFHLVVMGAIHGDEPSSALAALDLATHLRLHPPQNRCVWILPALNPDGLVCGTKNNARDVDLNRNFAARNFVTAHEPGYDPGPYPLSEPESRLFAAFLSRVNPAGVVAVHAPFAVVNFDGPALPWAQAVARACGWPARADLGYPTPGSFGSFWGRDGGRPVLTLELPPGDHAGFAPLASAALRSAVEFSFPNHRGVLPSVIA